MRKLALIFAIITVSLLVPAYAQDAKDLDNYRVRLDAAWWYAHPAGFFGSNGSNNYFDLNRDFGFQDYSTFTGKVDWRFKHKHHLLFGVAPVDISRNRTLGRTIQFQGQTFDIGARVSAEIKSLDFIPGYQYDLIRTNHGFLGLEVDLNLVDTSARLSATANVGSQQASASASKSLFAPLPVLGPTGRWYPLHDSNRLMLEGSFRGMYFFGYGNFLTARGDVGIGLTKHLMLKGGYQMGSRLSVHGTADQIALRVSDRGPTTGIEYSFGNAPEKKEKPVVTNASPGNWHVTWEPMYLWFTGLKGNEGTRGVTAPVDVSFSDVLSQLNIGLMSVLDVRWKRVGVLTDLFFVSITADQKNTPIGAAYSGFVANSRTTFIDPEVYFRALDKPRGSLDVIGGARFWHLNNSLVLFSAALPTANIGQTQTWLDPILGARARLNLAKGWFTEIKGDAGGFGVGSNQTWQINAGGGKEFKRKYDLTLAYRYLSVDYASGGFVYDTHMNGLVTGFAIRFK